LKLRFADLEHYVGERGRRGHKLPRGLQKVDTMEVRPIVESKQNADDQELDKPAESSSNRMENDQIINNNPTNGDLLE